MVWSVYNDGSIDGASSKATVESTGNNVGGLVGSNNSGGKVTGSNANRLRDRQWRRRRPRRFQQRHDQPFQLVRFRSGTNNVGGSVGTNSNGTLDGVFATGAVTSDLNNAGGLVGWNEGGIENSYATGDVAASVKGGDGANGAAGGLIGRLVTGTVRYSYATGSVSGNDWVGGSRRNERQRRPGQGLRNDVPRLRDG